MKEILKKKTGKTHISKQTAQVPFKTNSPEPFYHATWDFQHSRINKINIITAKTREFSQVCYTKLFIISIRVPFISFQQVNRFGLLFEMFVVITLQFVLGNNSLLLFMLRRNILRLLFQRLFLFSCWPKYRFRL